MAENASQESAARKGPGGGEPSKQKKGDAVVRAISLAVVMFGTWLLLSGYYLPLLLTLGIASTIVTVVIAIRMDVVDHETHPLHLTGRIFSYWAWLAKEIVVSAFDVTKRVLSPSMPISPRVVELPTTQTSELGQVVYANSITLTPGTCTIRVFENRILVHALTAENAAALAAGEMDRRVTGVESGP